MTTTTRTEALDAAVPGAVIHSVVLGSAGPYGIRSETVATRGNNQITTRAGATFNALTGQEVGPRYPDPFRVIVADTEAPLYRNL